MKQLTALITASLLALASAGCGVISDAPEAGAERFVPISNNAYLVRQGPMLDRYWIDGQPDIAAPRSPAGGPRAKRLYK
ncbi:MAG: hypothetical protein DI537_05345 [Stutzerimonas stutzeri]|nr:MAG: hypothetical protein DI537_05345 [Stutzerimonas stutzeri]